MADSYTDDTSDPARQADGADSDDQALADASDDADSNAGNNDVNNTAVSCDAPSKPPGTLIVTVKDDAGAVVEGASVSISGPASKQDTSKADGTAKFDDLPDGTYTATASKDGYVPPKAPSKAKVPAGGTARAPVVLEKIAVEIEINNTPSANDDIVQVKCAIPAHRHKVPCRIRLKKATPTDVNVVLTNPDGKLRFPDDADATKALTLAANRAWTAFEISGESGSAAIGDASIEAHHNSDTGALVGSKPATVFWFDNAKISVTKGGNYGFFSGEWTAIGTDAVQFSAEATIQPTGINCSAPQTKDLRIGILQNHLKGLVTDDKWTNPTITWDPGQHIRPGESVVVPGSAHQTVVVGIDTNDSIAALQPLYDRPGKGSDTFDPHSLNPPKGCTGGAASTSHDTPHMFAPVPLTKDAKDSTGATLGTVTWQHTTAKLVHSFVTWAVVFNTSTQDFCCVREAVWSLDTDAAAGGTQSAKADGTDRAPTITPLTTPLFNDEANKPLNYHSTWGPNVTITFPKTTT